MSIKELGPQVIMLGIFITIKDFIKQHGVNWPDFEIFAAVSLLVAYQYRSYELHG